MDSSFALCTEWRLQHIEHNTDINYYAQFS